MHEADDPLGSSLFQRTNPSELRRAGGGDADALGRLVAKYHAPLNAYLTLAFPSLKASAEELLQDFAQDRLLREGWLARVDLNRGRFRDFLKTSLRNYVLNWLGKKRRENSFVSLDDQTEEGLAKLELAAPPGEAVDAFDLEWLRAVVSETLRRMEADCRQPGRQQPRKGQTWEIFKLRLLGPAFQDTRPPSYGELVQRFDLKSPTEGTNMLLQAKRKFEHYLFEVVSEYESAGSQTHNEIQDLKQALFRLAGRR
jgi:DNA-directed RNA polymerase specialized sigma24 family protein